MDIENSTSLNSNVEIYKYDERVTPKEIKLIKEYMFTQKVSFKKLDDESMDNLFFGLEIEIDGGGDSKEKAKDVLDILGDNNCILKPDGSLKDGFEIITEPCTFEYHKSLNYEELFKKLKILGYEEKKSMGLHIHINKNFFGDNINTQDFCISKMIFIVTKYWDYVEKIARRSDNEYARKFNMSNSFFDLYTQAIRRGKYACVNLKHKNTIEFRMFSGTLNYLNLFANLEFIRNLAYICKDYNEKKIMDLEFKEIINYYNNEFLETYCNNRKIYF